MYSGIIYHIGQVVDLKKSGSGAQLKIKSPLFKQNKTGHSFAIDGVCLTQVDCFKNVSTFDISFETLSKTTIKDYQRGQQLHLEEPLLANTEIGGHFVQGHVDGIATLVEMSPDKLTIELSDELARFAISKGSIAIDGVSLTIAKTEGNLLEIALIPHTYQSTCFKEKEVGASVNIEMDMFSKMIYKYLDQMDLRKAFS